MSNTFYHERYSLTKALQEIIKPRGVIYLLSLATGTVSITSFANGALPNSSAKISLRADIFLTI